MSKRINLEVSDDVAELIQRVAHERELTVAEVVRRALSIVKAAEDQKKAGRPHIGFVADPSKLDTQILNAI
ncbi:MAG: hypothetical protein ACOYO0_01565 [Sandarakinorhabdus sp.]